MTKAPLPVVRECPKCNMPCVLTPQGKIPSHPPLGKAFAAERCDGSGQWPSRISAAKGAAK